MPIHLTSTARVSITNGELVAAPVFKNTAGGNRYARIRLQTTEAFLVGGQRRVRKMVHDVVVYNSHGIRLLEQFNKPGICFIVNGNLAQDDTGKPVIEVTAFGNDIFVSYVADQPDAPAAPAEPAESRPTASGARPSGGIGRLSGAQDSDERSRGYGTQSRQDFSDDDIPF